jgi:hypothetical protein
MDKNEISDEFAFLGKEMLRKRKLDTYFEDTEKLIPLGLLPI